MWGDSYLVKASALSAVLALVALVLVCEARLPAPTALTQAQGRPVPGPPGPPGVPGASQAGLAPVSSRYWLLRLAKAVLALDLVVLASSTLARLVPANGAHQIFTGSFVATVVLVWLTFSGLFLPVASPLDVARLRYPGQIAGLKGPDKVVRATAPASTVTGFACLTLLAHWSLLVPTGLEAAMLGVLVAGAAANSITRVLALLGAGVTCFLLSLAYNKVASDNAQASSPAEAPQSPAWPPAPPGMRL